jgi:signal transduction histidine kinase
MSESLWLAAAIAALALVVGALLAWRTMQSQRSLGDALRRTREERESLVELLDVWAWQSDAEHRLVSLRAPRGVPANLWSLPASSSVPTPFIWDHFACASPAVLRSQIENHAPLDDLPVSIAVDAGARRQGLLRGRMRSDAEGHFAGYVGLLRDVTPSSDVAMPPTDTSTLAAAASTSALPDTAGSDYESFSFTVSHDLRAPIRVVEGFTKIVKEDYGRLLDRVGNDHLDRVLGAAARMNNMIDALLGLAKLSSQPLAHQPVNLSQLARFVADDLARQWPERQVELAIASDLQVQGDPTLLRVVLENLLGNAWKYTGKAPNPMISFDRHLQNADAFTISDNGAGFDMRFADRLFGVFQRLHSANDFPGTGVGLASVRRIVRRHGGEIWGEGIVNGGAKFHFSLPANRRA